MLNPSYSSLIKILNEDAGADARVTSRYSIVIAAAKRARQIVGGAEYEDLGAKTDKAVSIAVNEIQRGFIKVVPGSMENIDMPLSEHVIQNLPTVIDDSFVSEDIIIVDEFESFDDDDAESIDDSFEAEDEEDWDDDETEDEKVLDDDEEDDEDE